MRWRWILQKETMFYTQIWPKWPEYRRFRVFEVNCWWHTTAVPALTFCTINTAQCVLSNSEQWIMTLCTEGSIPKVCAVKCFLEGTQSSENQHQIWHCERLQSGASDPDPQMPINTANHLACNTNEGKSQNTVRLERGGVVASLMKAVKELLVSQSCS